MLLRDQLAAIFSPTRRLIGPEPATVRTGGWLGELQWVVPRAALGYRRVDLAALPAKRRAAAAAIAAKRDAAGPARFQIAWQGPVAQVWTWDESEAAKAGVAPDAAWVPESLLRAAPAGDGLRLLRQVEGFEGQHWEQGELRASQWWPTVPGLDRWQRFVRACGLPASGDVPEPGSVPWSSPWADPRRGVPASPATLERWAWRVVAVVLALALGWQAAAELRWRSAHREVQARMSELRDKASPLLTAREQAERYRDELEDLRALQGGDSDYELVARIVAPLPEDVRLLEWQRDGERLQVALRAADADPRHFVTAYQSDPQLRRVVATPGEAGITMLDFELATPEDGTP